GGGSLIYSTFYNLTTDDFKLGGIAIDVNNRAYFDFSDTQVAPEDCECTFGELAVLNASGSALDYSIQLGLQNNTNAGQTFLNDVAVGSTGVAYVVGSSNFGALPTTTNAYQSALNSGSFDAIVGKFDT